MRRQRLRGDTAQNLADWSSIWTDLLHARQALAGMERTPPDWVFERRALWDSAVMSYGRCFKNGRRRALLRTLTSGQPARDQRIHDTLIKWRDKHVGHRVDADLEQSIVWGDFDDEAGTLDIQFEVTTTHTLSDANVADVIDYLSRLADDLWEGPLVDGENDLRVELGYDRLPFTPAPPDPTATGG